MPTTDASHGQQSGLGERGPPQLADRRPDQAETGEQVPPLGVQQS